MRRRLATVLVATVALVAMPSLAAALMVWTLVVTPLVATAGQVDDVHPDRHEPRSGHASSAASR